MTKSLKDISLPITEEEYRRLDGLSYSTLAKFDREGFNNLSTLFDRVESPSLTFGSAVDSIITGGMDEFNERFIVTMFPETPDSIITIVKDIFNGNKANYKSLNEVPNDIMLTYIEAHNYQNNWRPETRVKVVKEKGAAYYDTLFIAQGKTILDTKTYDSVLAAVDALKTSEATAEYFKNDTPFDNVERLYQLKFSGSNYEIKYKCMMDLVVVDHDNKIILPCDLKTSYKPEWDFYKSFVEWRYHIQARLYYRLLKQNCEKDPYFKDFTIKPYYFIVVNKHTLTPLVWEFEETSLYDDIKINDNIIMKDPYNLGEELIHYLEETPKVPVGITTYKPNNIMAWLK
jgi:hypothetical protein